jgi:hypothetical protein
MPQDAERRGEGRGASIACGASLSNAGFGVAVLRRLTFKEERMFKKWFRRQKAKLITKWAEELGFHVVQIKVSAGTEYIVDKNGAWRKLARAR